MGNLMGRRTVVVLLIAFIVHVSLGMLRLLTFLPWMLSAGMFVSLLIVLSIERLRIYSSMSTE